MALQSTGQISIGNVIRETLTGLGSTGTTTPTTGQVNQGISSLKQLVLLINGTGDLDGANIHGTNEQYNYDPWFDTGDTDASAPYSLGECRGAILEV
jgi:hypothetical protein